AEDVLALGRRAGEGVLRGTFRAVRIAALVRIEDADGTELEVVESLVADEHRPARAPAGGGADRLVVGNSGADADGIQAAHRPPVAAHRAFGVRGAGQTRAVAAGVAGSAAGLGRRSEGNPARGVDLHVRQRIAEQTDEVHPASLLADPN